MTTQLRRIAPTVVVALAITPARAQVARQPGAVYDFDDKNEKPSASAEARYFRRVGTGARLRRWDSGGRREGHAVGRQT